jgi:hypothetical protein
LEIKKELFAIYANSSLIYVDILIILYVGYFTSDGKKGEAEGKFLRG